MKLGKTSEIYRILKERLDGGVYQPGSKFPSCGRIAEEFGINKMTANKIVSMLMGEGCLVRTGSNRTGIQVKDSLLQKARGTLAFLGRISPYVSLVLNGVVKETRNSDFLLLLESPDMADFHRRVQFLRRSGVSGVISISCGIPELPPDMRQVCIDIPNPPENAPPNVYFINSDNYQGGFNIMSEILRRGHREILIFSSERFARGLSLPVLPRVRGMQHAMMKSGISDAESRCFYAMPGSLSDARNFLRIYLEKYPETTVIAADSDGSAHLIAEAARTLGISCPGSIALTGFGNITMLPIATVDQNAEYQGQLAARKLIGMEQEERQFSAEDSRIELVETTLVKTDHIPIRLHPQSL